MTPFLGYKTVTLLPYDTQPMGITGSVLVFDTSTASFLLSMDGGEYFQIRAGWSINLGDGTFSRLIFQNPTGAAITIGFYVGNAAMAYASQATILTVKDPATYVKAGAVQINAGATLQYNGTDGANVRKQIVVTNLDAALDLDVLDQAGNPCGLVFARSAWTIGTSGLVQLKNNQAAPLAIRVAEIFYA